MLGGTFGRDKGLAACIPSGALVAFGAKLAFFADTKANKRSDWIHKE